MKPKMFFALAATSLLLVTGCTSLTEPTYRVDLLGDQAPPTAATRMIAINSNTKFVHVRGGEIVTFTYGDKAFTWNFNGALTISSFDLNQIAPPGMLDKIVKVYIAPNPMYSGGGGQGGHHHH